MKSSKEIWDVLKKRYTVANRASNFKLNKETYEIAQNGRSIGEYYTQSKVVLDELKNLNNFPIVTSVSTKMRSYFEAVKKQKEERRLFKFLNGLD